MVAQLVHYWPFHPLPARLYDDGGSSLLEFRTEVDCEEISVALIGDSLPQCIRTRLQSTSLDPTYAQSNAIIRVRDAMLAAVRMSHNSEARLARVGRDFIWFFDLIQDGQIPWIDIKAELHDRRKIDGAVMRGAFDGSLSNPVVARMVGNACDLSIPVEYRILEQYKAVEYIFKHNGRWRTLRDMLLPFEGRFAELNINAMRLSRFFFEVRDACAHAVVGGRNLIDSRQKFDVDDLERYVSFSFDVIGELIGVQNGFRFGHLNNREYGSR